MNKRKTALIAATVVMLVIALSGLSTLVLADSSNGQNGCTLAASISATPTFVQKYSWSIDKSVTRSSWDLYKGDSATSQYTVTVKKNRFHANGVL
jgi:hypothetical protein